MKHNVFLGSGSGSIGDVTSYRREGTQVSRLRVREIANPKSYGQAQQRNFMAPVSKFYAPLAACLEQSFEGKSPAASYAAFASRNVKLARQNGWYLPKGTGFYPMPYQVSEGTLKPTGAKAELAESFTGIEVPVMITEAMAGETVGTLSSILVSLGYQDNDQVTIVFCFATSDGKFFPVYYRFFLDTTSEEPLSTLPVKVAPLVSGATSVVFEPINGSAVAGCIIISRYENEKWRRSTESMIVSQQIMTAITSEAAKENAIASYRNGEFVPISDVYLNGSTQQ